MSIQRRPVRTVSTLREDSITNRNRDPQLRAPSEVTNRRSEKHGNDVRSADRVALEPFTQATAFVVT